MSISRNKRATILLLIFLLFIGLAPVTVYAGSREEIQKNMDDLIRTNACVGCNLMGADLNRLDLAGADLRNADLTGATFFLADLSKANLSGAVLRGAKFGGADLAYADLRGADIRGARLDGAYTVGLKLEGTIAEKEVIDEDADLELVEKVYIPDESKPKETMNQKQVVLSGARDADSPAEVSESVQTGAVDDVRPGPETSKTKQEGVPPVKKVRPVSYVTIAEQASKEQRNTEEEDGRSNAGTKTEAGMKTPKPEADSAEMDEGEPERVDELNGNDAELRTRDAQPTVEAVTAPEVSEMMGASDHHTLTDGENLSAAPQPEPAGEAAMPPGDNMLASDGYVSETTSEKRVLVNQLLDTKRCYACDLAGVELAGKNLKGVDLEGANLNGADLAETDLRQANLKGATFQAANLQNADLREADLYKADFSNADLSGADLRKSLQDETKFNGAVGYVGEAVMAE